MRIFQIISKLAIISVAIACGLWGGCSLMKRFSSHRHVDINLYNVPLTLVCIEAGGKISEVEIPNGSDFYKAFQAWFADNRDEWRTSYDTFAQRCVLRSDRFSLNILQDGLVLNYAATSSDKNWVQVIKEPKPSPLWDDFLKELKKLQANAMRNRG
jgi:hypothetical protein